LPEEARFLTEDFSWCSKHSCVWLSMQVLFIVCLKHIVMNTCKLKF